MKDFDLMEQWAASRYLRPAGGRLCIQRLIGKRCGTHDYSADFLPPSADHCSLWIDGSGKPAVFVSQPYSLGMADAVLTAEFCQRLGLEFQISTYPSWHNPGSVVTVLYYVKGMDINSQTKTKQ